MKNLPFAKWLLSAMSNTSVPTRLDQDFAERQQLFTMAVMWGDPIGALQDFLQHKGVVGKQLASDLNRAEKASRDMFSTVVVRTPLNGSSAVDRLGVMQAAKNMTAEFLAEETDVGWQDHGKFQQSLSDAGLAARLSAFLARKKMQQG